MAAKIRVRRSTSYEIEFTQGGDERTFEVQFRPEDYHDPVVKILPDGRAVVGYLSHDDDCENPIENSDAMGKIYRIYRDAPRDERRQGLEEMGVDEYGEKSGKHNPLGVLLDVYIHSGEAWRVHGSGRHFPDEQWDVSNCAGIWVPDEACLHHIQMTAGEALLDGRKDYHASRRMHAKGELRGEFKHAKGDVEITQVYHPAGHLGGSGSYTYSWKHASGLAGDRYKTVTGAVRAACKALGRVFDKEAYRRECYAEALVCANQAIEEYNAWVSGDCHGVCVECFDKDGQPLESEEPDACWGYVGGDYAERTLEEEVESTYRRLLKETTETTA